MFPKSQTSVPLSEVLVTVSVQWEGRGGLFLCLEIMKNPGFKS
jgi:hypothetical protein